MIFLDYFKTYQLISFFYGVNIICKKRRSVYNILKGDGKIKKIKLRFIGVGYNDKYQAMVMIYDIYGNLIFKGFTYNGIIEVKLLDNCGYEIVAKFLNEVINAYFYVTCDKSFYVFYFNHAIVLDTGMETVNFLLTDQNYDGLAIERGELILWQR